MRCVTLVLCLMMCACSKPAPPEVLVPGRWYSPEQVDAGKILYAQYCAVCHATDGSATADWRTPDSTGIYPPPPLNGSAHTWHHPMEVLESTIMDGGIEFGGVMPGFANVLNRAERLAIIAWFQNLWTDEVYARWQAIDARD